MFSCNFQSIYMFFLVIATILAWSSHSFFGWVSLVAHSLPENISMNALTKKKEKTKIETRGVCGRFTAWARARARAREKERSRWNKRVLSLCNMCLVKKKLFIVLGETNPFIALISFLSLGWAVCDPCIRKKIGANSTRFDHFPRERRKREKRFIRHCRQCFLTAGPL